MNSPRDALWVVREVVIGHYPSPRRVSSSILNHLVPKTLRIFLWTKGKHLHCLERIDQTSYGVIRNPTFSASQIAKKLGKRLLYNVPSIGAVLVKLAMPATRYTQSWVFFSMLFSPGRLKLEKIKTTSDVSIHGDDYPKHTSGWAEKAYRARKNDGIPSVSSF